LWELKYIFIVSINGSFYLPVFYFIYTVGKYKNSFNKYTEFY